MPDHILDHCCHRANFCTENQSTNCSTQKTDRSYWAAHLWLCNRSALVSWLEFIPSEPNAISLMRFDPYTRSWSILTSIMRLKINTLRPPNARQMNIIDKLPPCFVEVHVLFETIPRWDEARIRRTVIKMYRRKLRRATGLGYDTTRCGVTFRISCIVLNCAPAVSMVRAVADRQSVSKHRSRLYRTLVLKFGHSNPVALMSDCYSCGAQKLCWFLLCSDQMRLKVAVWIRQH